MSWWLENLLDWRVGTANRRALEGLPQASHAGIHVSDNKRDCCLYYRHALSHIVTWRRSKQNTRKTVQRLGANLPLRMPCSKMPILHHHLNPKRYHKAKLKSLLPQSQTVPKAMNRKVQRRRHRKLQLKMKTDKKHKKMSPRFP